jgi:MOSC domain-containing protein YiiM
MEVVTNGIVTTEAGLEGDSRGRKYPRRQITVLSNEDWSEALAELAASIPKASGPPSLDWTVRRANVLVTGIVLPLGRGSILRIGDVELEVTGETTPCARMDEAFPGLRRALAPKGRGGATCRVTRSGRIALGDDVVVIRDVPQRTRHLPG